MHAPAFPRVPPVRMSSRRPRWPNTTRACSDSEENRPASSYSVGYGYQEGRAESAGPGRAPAIPLRTARSRKVGALQDRAEAPQAVVRTAGALREDDRWAGKGSESPRRL